MPVREPPTSYCVIWMPGACAIAAQMSRAFGISVSSSLVKLVPTCVVDVSTIGEAPVTVTVSCSVATCNLLIDGQRLIDDDADAFALDDLEARPARTSVRRRPAAAR